MNRKRIQKKNGKGFNFFFEILLYNLCVGGIEGCAAGFHRKTPPIYFYRR